VIRRVVVVLLAAVGLLGLLIYSQQRHEPFKVSGFIEADEIRVGSRVGGRVANVVVEEGQAVTPGTLLVELEPFDLLERASQAESVLAQRRAELDKLTNGFRAEEIAAGEERVAQLSAALKKLRNGPREQEIAAAKANLDQAESLLRLATDRFKRVEALIPSRAATQQEMDQARSELRVAQATQQARAADLDLLHAGTRPEEIEAATAQLGEAQQNLALQKNGYRKEEVAAAKAAASAAEAALAAIRKEIAELKITSPVAGTVEAVELQPGDLVSAGMAAISLMDTSHLWVRAYVPENRLVVQVRQQVFITVDSFPDRRFAAHVSFIARQAEFTPGNVQTPEERSKQVFRIKVMLDEGLDVLRPGMAADVWLEPVEEKKS